ncbi:hypothetical protein DSECCO2_524670 [anaerobic digester metagenome]
MQAVKGVADFNHLPRNRRFVLAFGGLPHLPHHDGTHIEVNGLRRILVGRIKVSKLSHDIRQRPIARWLALHFLYNAFISSDLKRQTVGSLSLFAAQFRFRQLCLQQNRKNENCNLEKDEKNAPFKQHK